MADVAAVGEVQPGRAVEHRPRPRVRPRDLAEVEAARRARRARPARRNEAERDRVAGHDGVDPGPDRLDDARALVAEDRRPAAVAQVAVGEADVRVADAGGRDAHEHLARPRRVERDGLHAQRRVALVQDGGADLHQATRCASSASRSGRTPRPGPGGGVTVPSAAISSRASPSSQSRRADVQPGGSSGTSRYGQVETAVARVQVRQQAEAVGPRVGRERAAAQVGERRDPPAAAEAAREDDIGLHDVDAARAG